MNVQYFYVTFAAGSDKSKTKEKETSTSAIAVDWKDWKNAIPILSLRLKNVIVRLPLKVTLKEVEEWLYVFVQELQKYRVCVPIKFEIPGESQNSESAHLVLRADNSILSVRYVVYYR